MQMISASMHHMNNSYEGLVSLVSLLGKSFRAWRAFKCEPLPLKQFASGADERESFNAKQNIECFKALRTKYKTQYLLILRVLKIKNTIKKKLK